MSYIYNSLNKLTSEDELEIGMIDIEISSQRFQYLIKK